jgi:tRNA(Arg) A34 adenosine deaminase TadA
MCFSAAIVAGVSTVIFALPSPADAGPGRVKMIDKATAVMPVVIGGVLESESRHLFEQWVSANKPGARHWEFVTKLLGITG